MKYIVYIKYTELYKPLTWVYIELNAKSLAAAVAEADAMFDNKKMYLIIILEKTGKPEKVESDIKAQLYTAILKKRSISGQNLQSIKHYISSQRQITLLYRYNRMKIQGYPV